MQPGKKVMHPDLGEGVIVGIEPTGFARVFFRSLGERRVPAEDLREVESWADRVISGLQPVTPDALERLWLAVEAVELPLLESVATLTAAKVDLLPHQIVLVHRIANAQPRRFLIADEVGLGKTIETALILRELAFRGELRRALVIVPAGLVDNWQQELNQVFDLDFEVFGAEGDVTDRKSNAFARHNRLIVSIDTLKRCDRVRRLLEAPPWDVVVFDEAHHLSAYRNGRKVRKTENFKLAEALRDRCRDLLLLSATPHQGDHFRFWMLIRLLNPALFEDERDMIENRHRLNAVVIRRTKAEACAADGSPLFARRVVYTQGFTLSVPERAFYEALLEYLREGYNLAAKQGNQGRALGFVMTVFQKIAASSFAAVKATLKKRLLMLTIQEAIERDELLDVDGRDRALQEARALIREMHGLPEDAVGRAQADQLLAEARVQLLKKWREAVAFASATEPYEASETMATTSEESAAGMVTAALPRERQKIRDLLQKIPAETETKTAVLLNALKQLWHVNPSEKVIVFATYLGSIEVLKDAIERAFPDKGVEVLKGGDHGAKLAAQRRFRRQNGPQVLLCTAAGREGINLQFARVLFNYDLPWNPVDLEQRIGRIHRYGQVHTAQVYNLVATDTIEGRIFLLLEEKLQGIAKTLGKIDEQGQIAEDFRAQVLGQLSSRLSYDRLYQEAILDPSLERSRQELEVALANANLAREVVFELFQDLEKFDLSQYKNIDDKGHGMRRLVAFAQWAAHVDGGEFRQLEEGIYELVQPGKEWKLLFTTDRTKALQRDDLHLLGLEHPVIKAWLNKYSSLLPEQRALIGNLEGNSEATGLVTVWHVTVQGKDGRITQRIVRLGISADGERAPYLERLAEDISRFHPSRSETRLPPDMVANLINGRAAELLHRELVYSGLLSEGSSYSSRLLVCLVVEP